jgi:hypothetical protein
MKRRIPPSTDLPLELRNFTHRKWLEAAEDASDPIRCHVTAPLRFQAALTEAMGTSPSDPAVAALVHQAFNKRSPRCTCHQCVQARTPKIS